MEGLRDKTKGLDRDLLVDRPTIRSVSWKDLLVGNSNPDSRRLVAPFGANADEDLDLLEGHIKKSLVNGIPSIEFSEKIQHILIKDMGTIVVLKLLGRQLEKLGRVTVGSLGPNGDIALMSKVGRKRYMAVKVGGSHQAQLHADVVGDVTAVRDGVSLISAIRSTATHFNPAFKGPVEFAILVLKGGLDLGKHIAVVFKENKNQFFVIRQMESR
ncbi:hypothetical protein J1N35_029480 [Gossypium stocksii]|uniref:Uncharacterized protein n=1 Tax=Gossypium stocksii TaxID=47602 RepID=A0A9D3ZT51_9ROSI|nr:hypothetical protein J1N35_029480 [Gossypium stocksii]